MSNSLAKDSLILMIGRGGVFLVSVITPIILVRIFSVGEYGEYRQAMLVVSTAATILPFGMPNSLYYFFPHFPAEKGVYLSRTIVIISLIGGLFCLLTWIFASDMALFFKNPRYVETSAIIGLSAFMFAFSSVIDTVLLADGEVLLSTKVMIVARLVQVPILIICAFTGGFLLLLKGFLFSLSCKSLYSIWFFRKRYKISLFQLNLSSILPHLKYGIPLGLGATFSMLSASADKFIVSHYLGEKLFAIYSVGCYELPVMIVIFSSIGDVVLPTIVKLKSMNKTEEVIKTWHRAIEQSMLIGIPVCIFMFAYANEFITTVFTIKYVDAVPIFRISIITIFLESLRYGMITRGYARTSFMLFVSIFTFILMLPATYFGIKYFGMIGAIGAFVSMRCLNVGSEIIFSKYILSLKFNRLLPFKYIAKITVNSLLCLVLPLIFASYYVFRNSWVQLFYLLFFTLSSYVYLTNYLGFWDLGSLPVSESIKKKLMILLPGRKSHGCFSA